MYVPGAVVDALVTGKVPNTVGVVRTVGEVVVGGGQVSSSFFHLKQFVPIHFPTRFLQSRLSVHGLHLPHVVSALYKILINVPVACNYTALMESWILTIKKTCPCNIYPLKPDFYIGMSEQ